MRDGKREKIKEKEKGYEKREWGNEKEIEKYEKNRKKITGIEKEER